MKCNKNYNNNKTFFILSGIRTGVGVQQSYLITIMTFHDVIVIIIHECLAPLKDCKPDVNWFTEIDLFFMHRHCCKIFTISGTLFKRWAVNELSHFLRA